jgi:hypothetical protein
MIVEQAVTNQVVDMGLLKETAEPARVLLDVEKIDVVDPVRFIDAFVDGLDLKAAGFERVAPKATGRPGYAPGDLLKLYIYGYLNRVDQPGRGHGPAERDRRTGPRPSRC